MEVCTRCVLRYGNRNIGGVCLKRPPPLLVLRTYLHRTFLLIPRLVSINNMTILLTNGNNKLFCVTLWSSILPELYLVEPNVLGEYLPEYKCGLSILKQKVYLYSQLVEQGISIGEIIVKVQLEVARFNTLVDDLVRRNSNTL